MTDQLYVYMGSWTPVVYDRAEDVPTDDPAYLAYVVPMTRQFAIDMGYVEGDADA
jgi:hypothetical protein